MSHIPLTFIEGGITAPLGFKAAGVAANINGKNNDKKDIALIYSDLPATAAGVCTTNCVKAAPVLLTQALLQAGTLQGIVINSRNANACTGEQGLQDAKMMCQLAAKALKLEENLVAVASTGIIGVPLPMERIAKGIAAAAVALNTEGSCNAAFAIMTTDTFPKEIALQFILDGASISIGGIAKGSGMIHPHMATTLGFITSDAHISPAALQSALKEANEKSFNMISVDGDTSTNDMLLLLANGMAGNSLIEQNTPAYDAFVYALEKVLVFLAKSVARDGEGATKLLEVRIKNAASEEDAKRAARAVCSSLLVKTALFASDANWGRILCALGYSGAHFDPGDVNLSIGNIPVMEKGAPLPFDEKVALRALCKSEVVICADLQSGTSSAVGWGCDLSYEYVKINGAYRT